MTSIGGIPSTLISSFPPCPCWLTTPMRIITIHSPSSTDSNIDPEIGTLVKFYSLWQQCFAEYHLNVPELSRLDNCNSMMLSSYDLRTQRDILKAYSFVHCMPLITPIFLRRTPIWFCSHPQKLYHTLLVTRKDVERHYHPTYQGSY